MTRVEGLPIGAVSAATGVSVSALRYWDDLGLIAAVGRVGGKRRFDEATTGRVSFIRRAQGLGFSLDEIGRLLDDTAGDWRRVVVEKRSQLVSRRDELETMITMLDEVARCGCVAVADCPGVSDPGRAR